MKNHVFPWSLIAAVTVALVAGCGGSSSGGTTGGTGCFQSSGTGTSETCTFVTTDVTCPAGDKSGSCPSAGLVGCCTTALTSGGTSVPLGVCYYDSAAEAADKAACTSGT
jgi:hypothetical protein